METLKTENIQIVDSAADWMDAIRISVRPLEEHGYVKECYSDAIIENVKNLGAYFILAPGVAMPHARPEQGVLKTQLGITLFRNPVHFEGKDDDTRLFVVLAAADSDQHIDAMVMIATALGEDEKVEQLCQAKSVEELYQLFTA